jgi:hypothetical protein
MPDGRAGTGGREDLLLGVIARIGIVAGLAAGAVLGGGWGLVFGHRYAGSAAGGVGVVG